MKAINNEGKRGMNNKNFYILESYFFQYLQDFRGTYRRTVLEMEDRGEWIMTIVS